MLYMLLLEYTLHRERRRAYRIIPTLSYTSSKRSFRSSSNRRIYGGKSHGEGAEGRSTG